ncbi:MAG: phosphatase PAP2 family protein [Alphaproteobacteria bacterium]|nr:phosphatase PAP2 family protein [Alphaproteobacteria bacterium]MBN2675578.1 phosphatase PAP2 family protein [Alphaproteobacteria bacterium]
MFLEKNNIVKWNLILIAFAITVILCLVGVLWFDKPLFLFFRNFNWSVWNNFDTIFATKVWLIVSAGFSVAFFIKNTLKTKSKNKKHTKKLNLKNIINNFIEKSKTNSGFLIFCSVFFASLISGFLKFGFGRQRPIFYEALGQSGFYPMTNEWAFNSMPSGHTTASFAGLVMIGLLFPKYKWATWTLAIIIGLSRISFGAHFPSDVILGAFIGMISADIIKSVFYNKK